MVSTLNATPPLSGYDTDDRYYATMYQQGGRTVYSIDLSLAQAVATLPKPNPDRPSQGNRRVKESHARAFAQYVRENTDWIAPALLLRSSEGVLHFEVDKEIAGTKFGILAVPRLAREDLRILDGQHRILGLNYAMEDIAAELEKARSQRASARRNHDAGLESHFSKIILGLERTRERFQRERISLQIHVEGDAKSFMQMFVDVADNALGITSAIRARFDTRKVVNRALEGVFENRLLSGRTDFEEDRIGSNSIYLLGVKHVADIIRVVGTGIGGRVGRRLESELKEADLIRQTNAFFDTLIAGFPEIQAVVQGQLTPAGLRHSSLLGSITMLKVLAGVYYNLAARGMNDAEIAEFFTKLAPAFYIPIDVRSPLLSSGVFNVGSTAPQGRRQDLVNLVTIISGWAVLPPAWMDADESDQKEESGE